MSIAAGSKKRHNVQGHVIVASLELITAFRRIPSSMLLTLFRQAREQGMAPLQLNERTYLLTRHPDHTYTLEPQDERHRPML